ncbi:fumarylacetoacetate hydrolase domain-containing protein 2A isoform X2 [Hypanus sabinus]|uniref:fumarylacetoacetate hydrolase domain-containing protein 2A isoform X2 n=1 Tax=Hypanus sabinus TaxID=79690 RepID=UPI0028C43A95|nr:fumarylacetoacetate hydrolase domain-containing protein 2A isoform X2 [Hypanus sabinus]XP_059822743.1 fumarylacetoacetate hydrolase domain-containing protein 2A isoform X2 [Hypanus sabinus]
MQAVTKTTAILRLARTRPWNLYLNLNCPLQVRRLSESKGLKMRLVQFLTAGDRSGMRVGVQERDGGNVIDLNLFDNSLPRNMKEFLEKGDVAMETARRALDYGSHALSLSEIELLSPVTNPDKVVCVGMNYMDHCLEQNVPIPKEPVIFSKFGSSIVGPYSDIIHPKESNEVDWEVELAFVIGKKGKHIQKEEAMNYVAGFMVAHDVSARDWQMKRNGKQWLLGKTFDTFCPLGPAIVTRDALSDPHNLGIRCHVNQQIMQDSNTSQLIFKTEDLVAWVSQFVTLYPGDVFLTGTPSGVGVFRNPSKFLRRGDIVECEIDEIGILRNAVI